MNLYIIRLHLLIFLVQLIDQYPDSRHGPCPTVWMDGEGGMLEANLVTDHGAIKITPGRSISLIWGEEEGILETFSHKVNEQRVDLEKAGGGVGTLLYAALEVAGMLENWR
jgi:hypothetical protein